MLVARGLAAIIYGMAGAGAETGCSVGTVRYHTAVRLPLPDLPNSTKRRIWRDRQIQAQAYNWGGCSCWLMCRCLYVCVGLSGAVCMPFRLSDVWFYGMMG